MVHDTYDVSSQGAKTTLGAATVLFVKLALFG